MHTPWGYANCTTQLAEGIYACGAAGHGGIGINADRAAGLTAAALAEGENYGGFLWYEEDCAWAILTAEAATQDAFTATEIEHGATLNARWNADYLAATA